MLSRLTLQAGQRVNPCLSNFNLIRTCSTGAMKTVSKASTVLTKEDPERDLVNFPRLRRQEYPSKVRMGFIPDEWFTYFYPKTGVTGPYAFGIGLITYLCSKEIFVLEQEFYGGVSLGIMLFLVIKKVGPSTAAFFEGELESIRKGFTNFREGSIAQTKEGIENEKNRKFSMRGQSMLYDAKRENIGLQLEAAYRERMEQVHKQVKQKLDYQLETANVKTRLEQKHMVNWIVEGVRKSITPAQELASLKQCLANLKDLAKV